MSEAARNGHVHYVWDCTQEKMSYHKTAINWGERSPAHTSFKTHQLKTYFEADVYAALCTALYNPMYSVIHQGLFF